MPVLNHRSCPYKLGLACLALGFCLFVFGFGYPAWVYYSLVFVSARTGLWQKCLSSVGVEEICETYPIGDNDAWFEIVRAVEAVTLVLYLVGLGLAIKNNLGNDFPHRSWDSGLIGVMFLTGGLGMAGDVLYSTRVLLTFVGGYSYAFYCATCGSAAAFAAAIFFCINRQASRGTVIHPGHPQQGMVVVQQTTMNQGGMYRGGPQGYNGYPNQPQPYGQPPQPPPYSAGGQGHNPQGSYPVPPPANYTESDQGMKY